MGGMEKLLARIEKTKKSGIKETIDSRMRGFGEAGKGNEERIFSELCFCLLTANFNAERSIRIQNEMGKEFHCMPNEKLRGKLRALGHRFPNRRADFICEARQHKHKLKGIIESAKDERELRNWLAENVKGLGLKEASHFLRNIGFGNVAIIDFHIADILAENGLIEKQKAVTKNKYFEIEKVLEKIAEKAKMSLAELDLYLWYLETGKVLK